MKPSLDIPQLRLSNQLLTRQAFTTPREVVGWLGAVQAQDYAGAKWALGLRLPQVTDSIIEEAVSDGSILRTHVMRPTWHFVTPESIRWMLELTAPRVNAASAYQYRQQELDDALFARSNAAITAALRGGRCLTRTELAAVLAQAGIPASGVRLAYIVMRAELDAVICSGPRRGKQFTYALLDERGPQFPRLSRDEALAELTRRYFTSHGPATLQDFAGWSGLTVADGRAGLEMNRPQLVEEQVSGRSHWRSASSSAMADAPARAFLLPAFDEYTVAYANHEALLEAGYQDLAKATIYSGVTVIAGRLIGNWRRTFNKGTVIMASLPFRPFTATENELFASAARRFGEFVNMPVILA